MTQHAGLLTYGLARADSTSPKTNRLLGVLLPLFELSVHVLVSIERKRSYCAVPRMNVRQEEHESFC